MKEYIKAEELSSVLYKAIMFLDADDDKYARGFCDGLRSVIDIAATGYKKLSTDNVVEVVRCGECKYCFGNTVKFCEINSSCKTAEDFCSKGVRKI